MAKTKVKVVAERRRRLILARLKMESEIRKINAILADIENLKTKGVKE